MSDVEVIPADQFAHDFLPARFRPDGQDEYYLRNAQVGLPADTWRPLRSDEIEALVRNANDATDWDGIRVRDPFTPRLIRHCEFAGLVRIGRLEDVVLRHHELHVPAGLTHSRLLDCDVGDNAAIHHVRYLAHYIVGDRCMLLNLDEMHCTNHAKFGNGVVKDGEDESVRITIDLMNESGGRAVVPFDGMTCGDAYLWARHRDDTELMARLAAITQKQFDPRRGFYGTVGDGAVLKSCRIIKDVRVGAAAYIKGANKLKNLTINSTPEEPTQIGEGVELVNGVIAPGCRVFYGCKAVRFLMGPRSTLKYGARLLHSYLGDNSTVSCCELLNNLLFPAHEQHHNNSFLTAALIRGQSNIAAGATIGSNHNSRANDGELLAGRGFWPGLCVTLKHPSRFASFCLLVKGDYPAELDVPLPFCLLSNDPRADRLLLLPAYWWLHNTYALVRNAWKVRARDQRRHVVQHVEYDALAPDTAEEIFTALRLLERWTGRAMATAGHAPGPADEAALEAAGREALRNPAGLPDGLVVRAEGVERGRRPVVVRKPAAGHAAYRQMLHFYAAGNVLAYLEAHPGATVASMQDDLAGPRQTNWVNLGGQLMPREDVDRLRADIKAGRLDSWDDIHAACDALWRAYPRAKQRHALATLQEILGVEALTPEALAAALDELLALQEQVAQRAAATRRRDHEDAFRQITFESLAERRAVLGDPADDRLVRQVQAETEALRRRVADVRERLR